MTATGISTTTEGRWSSTVSDPAIDRVQFDRAASVCGGRSFLSSGLGDRSCALSPSSIMRRRFVAGALRMSLGLLQALAQVRDLARQRVDLEPLRGDGLVQRLDGLVLKHQPGFERVDAVAERLHLTHRNPVPFGAPASRGLSLI